jgi:hypothetical protein
VALTYHAEAVFELQENGLDPQLAVLAFGFVGFARQ